MGYPVQQEKEEKARWKLTMLAKQIGLNISDLSKDEIAILMGALKKSEKYRQERWLGMRRQ